MACFRKLSRTDAVSQRCRPCSFSTLPGASQWPPGVFVLSFVPISHVLTESPGFPSALKTLCASFGAVVSGCDVRFGGLGPSCLGGGAGSRYRNVRLTCGTIHLSAARPVTRKAAAFASCPEQRLIWGKVRLTW